MPAGVDALGVKGGTPPGLSAIAAKRLAKRPRATKSQKKRRGALVNSVIAPSADYKPSYAKAARILCSIYGSSAPELAEFFRVSPPTINLWLRTRPDFRAACQDGATSANMMVMQRLYRQAVGFYYQGEKVFYDSRRGKVIRTTIKEYVPPSETAQIFWLKNRMPEVWKDKHELVGKDGTKLAGDLYQLFNVQVSPDAAIDTYNKLLQIEARADVEFKDKGK